MIQLKFKSRAPESSSVWIETIYHRTNIFERDLTSDKDSSSFYPVFTKDSNEKLDSNFSDTRKQEEFMNAQSSYSSSENMKNQFRRQL